MINSEIGENAGRIWQILNEKGELSLKQIKKDLKIKKGDDLFLALGWLFREDKLIMREDGADSFVSLK